MLQKRYASHRHPSSNIVTCTPPKTSTPKFHERHYIYDNSKLSRLQYKDLQENMHNECRAHNRQCVRKTYKNDKLKYTLKSLRVYIMCNKARFILLKKIKQKTRLYDTEPCNIV